jgi:hypothetical protein
VVSRKAEKREKSRLIKAEKSALIDKHIEEELLKNLQSGKYNSIWNVSQKNFEKVLDKQEIEEENEEEFNSEEIDNVFVGDVYGGDANDDDDFEDDEDIDADGKYKNDFDGDFDDYLDDEDDKPNKNNVSKSFSEDAKSYKSNLNTTGGSMVNKKRHRPNKNKINLEYEYDKTKSVELEKNLDW